MAKAQETALARTIEWELEEELLARHDLKQLYEGSGKTWRGNIR